MTSWETKTQFNCVEMLKMLITNKTEFLASLIFRLLGVQDHHLRSVWIKIFQTLSLLNLIKLLGTYIGTKSMELGTSIRTKMFYKIGTRSETFKNNLQLKSKFSN